MRRLETENHRWLRKIQHVSSRDRMPSTVVRENTGQEELGCITRRRLGHVARTSDDSRAKQVINRVPGEKRVRGR